MSKPESGKTFEVKCVVVGNTGTGKTCIVQRLAFDTFIDNPESTVSAANFLKLSNMAIRQYDSKNGSLGYSRTGEVYGS